MATERRKYFSVADSVADEDWTNDELAALVRLMARMNTRWARNNLSPDEASQIRLGPTEVMAISGKRRRDIAVMSLRHLADVASMSARLDGDIVEITWPKFPIFQSYESRARPQRRSSVSVSVSGTVTATETVEEKTKSGPKKPPAPRSCVCPDRLEPEARERILKWAAANRLSHEQVAYGWLALKDWSASKNEKRADWEATLRNALRKGWVLDGFVPKGGSTPSRYRDADDVIAEAKRKQAEDEARSRDESPEEVGKLIDLSLRREGTA